MSFVPTLGYDGPRDYDEPTADLTAELDSQPLPHEAGAKVFAPAKIASPQPKKEQSHAAAPVMPVPGEVLRGRYRIEAVIGRGGNCVVYRARDLTLGTDAASNLALKMPHVGGHRAAAAVQRLKREFQIAQVVSHPNTVRIYDLDRDDATGSERWFMTMELLEGRSLTTVLHQEGDIGVKRARDILRACGAALTYAHERGIVHGDFKPGNVFITHTGAIRVVDFGNASLDKPANGPPAQATASYASPEVLLGFKPERADDVFSFACVAYELLNGRHPFNRRPALEARAGRQRPPRAWTLREPEWAVLEAALAHERARRPTLPVLIQALTAVPQLKSAPVTVAHVPLRITAEREDMDLPPPSDHPVRRFFGTFVLILVLGALSFAAWDRLHPAYTPEKAFSSLSGLLNDLPVTRAPQVESPPTQQTAPLVQPIAPQPVPVAPLPANEPQPTAAAPPPAATVPSRRRTAIAAPEALPSSYVSFADAEMDVGERTSAVTLSVNRLQSLTGRASVRWRIVPGSAQAGQDYENASGILDFPEGHGSRMIYIPIVNDTVREGPETFSVEFFQPSRATQIGPLAKVRVTVHDDD